MVMVYAKLVDGITARSANSVKPGMQLKIGSDWFKVTRVWSGVASQRNLFCVEVALPSGDHYTNTYPDFMKEVFTK
jgi:hypothetical protein